MKTKISMILLLSSFAFAIDPSVNKTKSETGIKQAKMNWVVPSAMSDDGYLDEEKLPKGSKYIEAVILGNKILNETTYYIGPKAKDESKRYAGNNLSCSSCHANGGTIPYESGFVGIYARFPQYLARGDVVATLENRINGCMERSMNGKPLPINSVEMKAIVTYMHYLSQGVPVGANVEGQGLTQVKLLNRAADPKKGKVIYEEKCSACHGEDGAGMLNDEQKGGYYVYPALWGDDSYNTGAGMYRLIKAASYIKGNMPKGDATLSDEEAFDVAAYINSKPRPIKANREADFPDRRTKPLDMDVAPYDDDFSIEQHRFGPYIKMQEVSKSKAK
ncbi:c-type cytochrome [Campylobacter sp. RM12637]|uniref:c-type cytochrome n=1 Tax=Campylobacter sp. RM12637 TaxID=2735734 RepID=UPI003014B9E2|nr:c-type cytochrome [Campylobacter sp. RM12637]